MEIIKMLGTNCTSYYANRPHLYIAIHYTAGVTSKRGSARNTASWFANPQNRNGSADFIVDDVEIVQYNADLNNRRCWAVGDDSRKYSKGGSLYGVAVNCNTISIEICSSSMTGSVPPANSPNWYFTDAAVENALKLTRYLMKAYNIDADHVVRHYDISGKYCPGIIGWNANSGDESKWRAFKARLNESEEIDMTVDQLKALFDKWIDEKLIGADTKPDQWAINDGFNEAKELGITDGSRPKGYTTRQESAIMALREHKKNVDAGTNVDVKAELKKALDDMNLPSMIGKAVDEAVDATVARVVKALDNK